MQSIVIEGSDLGYTLNKWTQAILENEESQIKKVDYSSNRHGTYDLNFYSALGRLINMKDSKISSFILRDININEG